MGIRQDGREPDELRPVSFVRDFTDFALGSTLVDFGRTRVLCTASLEERVPPWLRGTVCGVMTTIGGVGHTLPYLIHDFWVATILAVFVVAVELVAISYIRYRFMDTPFLSAAFQVVLGGTLVFLAGIFIGSS